MVAEVEKAAEPSRLAEALAWPDQVRAVTIVDQATYDTVAGLKLNLAAFRKTIVEEFKVMKDAAYKAHKAVCDKESDHLKPIVEAEELAVSAIKKWSAEQERLRLAEQRRIDAENRAREEEGRKRREAEAAAIRAEDERRAAELCAKDEEARLQRAYEAEAAGASAGELMEIINTPVVEVPEVLPVEAYMEPAPISIPQVAAPTYEKQKGLGISTRWGARVFSIKDLCRAVADGKAPENFVMPNMPALNARAKSDQTGMNVPGVRAVKE